MSNKVICHDVSSMAAVVREFMAQGLAFSVAPSGNYWVITVTGY